MAGIVSEVPDNGAAKFRWGFEAAADGGYEHRFSITVQQVKGMVHHQHLVVIFG